MTITGCVPNTSLIKPEKLVEALFPPTVNVANNEAFELVTVPPVPAREPMLLLKPFRSSVAPADNITAEFEPNADVEPAVSLPALTIVGPV